MMKLRLLLISMLLLVVPVFAQDDTTTHTLTDEELALVEEIEAIYNQFMTYPSIGVEVVQLVEQTITFGEESMYQEISMTIDTDTVLVDGNAVAFSATTDQVVDADPLTGSLSMSMIYVDEELYINITGGDGVYEGVFPAGWNKVSEVPELQELVGPVDINSLNQLDIQFTPELVKSISVVAEDDLVDASRAIYVSLLPEALKEQGFADEIAQGMFGESSEEFEDLILTLLSEAEMDLIYNFDADGLLTRVDTVMTFTGDLGELVGVEGFILNQQLNQVATYRYYDEALVITAPETE
jgi:hypothetical protein